MLRSAADTEFRKCLDQCTGDSLTGVIVLVNHGVISIMRDLAR